MLARRGMWGCHYRFTGRMSRLWTWADVGRELWCYCCGKGRPWARLGCCSAGPGRGGQSVILLTLTSIWGFVTLSMTRCASPLITEYNQAPHFVFPLDPTLHNTPRHCRARRQLTRCIFRSSASIPSEPNYDPIMASWYIVVGLASGVY